MVKLEIQEMAKLKCTPKVDFLSYPSYFDYNMQSMIKPEFCKSGWEETRRQWRLYNVDKQLTKEMDRGTF